MIFNYLIGLLETSREITHTKYREAVRAVIFQDQKILLVQSNRGDYKFPGGGVEMDESHEAALLREVAEETGYVNGMVIEKMGTVIERRPDKFQTDTIFQMNSHYYLCELNNEEKVAQKLDDYENEQDFTPKWVRIDEAIAENRIILQQVKHNGWIRRENYVLNQLKKFYHF